MAQYLETKVCSSPILRGQPHPHFPELLTSQLKLGLRTAFACSRSFLSACTRHQLTFHYLYWYPRCGDSPKRPERVPRWQCQTTPTLFLPPSPTPLPPQPPPPPPSPLKTNASVFVLKYFRYYCTIGYDTTPTV